MKLSIPKIPRKVLFSLIGIIGVLYWLLDKPSEDVALIGILCIVTSCIFFLIADAVGFLEFLFPDSKDQNKIVTAVIRIRYQVAAIASMILILSIIKHFLE
jgi:uncharacterized membrane protein